MLLRFKYRCAFLNKNCRAATLVFGVSMSSQEGTEKQTDKQITGQT
jgi:hypothetical protein